MLGVLSRSSPLVLSRLTPLRPQLALAQELVQEFLALTRQRDAAALEPGRERVAGSGIVERERFRAGLQRDGAAVVAGPRRRLRSCATHFRSTLPPVCKESQYRV